MLFRILEGKARPSRIQDVLNLLVQQAEDTTQQSGGLLFLQVLHSGDNVMAVTSWRSEDDMEVYLRSEKTQVFYRKLPSLLMGIPTIRTFDVVKTVVGDGAADAPAAFQWVRK